jgi:hypothetical protein
MEVVIGQLLLSGEPRSAQQTFEARNLIFGIHRHAGCRVSSGMCLIHVGDEFRRRGERPAAVWTFFRHIRPPVTVASVNDDIKRPYREGLVVTIRQPWFDAFNPPTPAHPLTE